MTGLYSPDILRLALACADFPSLSGAHARVERRAPLCGSRIALDMRMDARGRVKAVGFAVHACAVGQASAALLAREARGRRAEELAAVSAGLARWLDDPAAPVPDWPGIDILSPVRALPARRGAALMPFEAAVEAATQASRAVAT